jgi:hypothetical protein
MRAICSHGSDLPNHPDTEWMICTQPHYEILPAPRREYSALGALWDGRQADAITSGCRRRPVRREVASRVPCQSAGSTISRWSATSRSIRGP